MTKETPCKAFLIDPELQRITQVEYSGDYKNIYEHIKADTFDCARFNADGDGVFVDDNGLLNGPEHFFVVEGYAQPLAGRGLVLGVNEDGESIAPRVTLEWLQAHVAFVHCIGQGAIAVTAPGTMAGRVMQMFGGG